MMVQLGSVMDQIRGVSYKGSDAKDAPGISLIPILRATNIQDCRITETDLVYVPVEYVNNSQILKKNDVLIAASSGSISIVGKAAALPNDMEASFGAFCKVLRPNTDLIDAGYFKHYFETQSYLRTIRHLAEGANINNLKTEHFEKLKIPLPPLDEQKKIAAILDAADELRQKDKALIVKYDELVQSIFLDIFGDPFSGETQGLANNISIVGGYAFKSIDFVDEGIPLIKIGTVNKGYFDIENFSFLPEEYSQKYIKWKITPGDILMSLTGTVGKDDYGNVERADSSYPVYLLNQRVAKIAVTNENYLPDFLFQMLKHPKTKRMLTKISRGVRQANISNGDILSLNMIVPPIGEQTRFVRMIESISSQRKTADSASMSSGHLFNSLLQKAFKGEIAA